MSFRRPAEQESPENYRRTTKKVSKSIYNRLLLDKLLRKNPATVRTIRIIKNNNNNIPERVDQVDRAGDCVQLGRS